MQMPNITPYNAVTLLQRTWGLHRSLKKQEYWWLTWIQWVLNPLVYRSLQTVKHFGHLTYSHKKRTVVSREAWESWSLSVTTHIVILFLPPFIWADPLSIERLPSLCPFDRGCGLWYWLRKNSFSVSEKIQFKQWGISTLAIWTYTSLSTFREALQKLTTFWLAPFAWN